MKTKKLFTLPLSIVVMAALIWVVAKLTPEPPPTVQYAGRAANGALFFEIQNPSDTTWTFFGLGPATPLYRWETNNGSDEWTPDLAADSTTPKRVHLYAIAPRANIRFEVPPPPAGSQWINIRLRICPSPLKCRIDYYRNRISSYLHLPIKQTSIVQQSGAVPLDQ